MATAWRREVLLLCCAAVLLSEQRCSTFSLLSRVVLCSAIGWIEVSEGVRCILELVLWFPCGQVALRRRCMAYKGTHTPMMVHLCRAMVHSCAETVWLGPSTTAGGEVQRLGCFRPFCSCVENPRRTVSPLQRARRTSQLKRVYLCKEQVSSNRPSFGGQRCRIGVWTIRDLSALWCGSNFLLTAK